MPYVWSDSDTPPDARRLNLWPHRSLSRQGFAAFIAVTSAMLVFPLYPLIGSVVLWGILPFLMLAVGSVWWALEKSYDAAKLHEVLTISNESVHLIRTNPRGDTQEWDCNSYWTQVNMHPKGGPVTFYVTLAGKGREVEIGSFLSEDERKALYGELTDALRRVNVAEPV